MLLKYENCQIKVFADYSVIFVGSLQPFKYTLPLICWIADNRRCTVLFLSLQVAELVSRGFVNYYAETNVFKIRSCAFTVVDVCCSCDVNIEELISLLTAVRVLS